jgi:hypothetical protein
MLLLISYRDSDDRFAGSKFVTRPTCFINGKYYLSLDNVDYLPKGNLHSVEHHTTALTRCGNHQTDWLTRPGGRRRGFPCTIWSVFLGRGDSLGLMRFQDRGQVKINDDSAIGVNFGNATAVPRATASLCLWLHSQARAESYRETGGVLCRFPTSHREKSFCCPPVQSRALLPERSWIKSRMRLFPRQRS